MKVKKSTYSTNRDNLVRVETFVDSVVSFKPVGRSDGTTPHSIRLGESRDEEDALPGIAVYHTGQTLLLRAEQPVEIGFLSDMLVVNEYTA